MMNKGIRYLAGVLMIIILAYVGSWFVSISWMSHSSPFMPTVTIILFALLIIGVIIWSIDKMKSKNLRYAFFTIIICYIIINAGYELRRDYIKNIPTVGDSEVDLREYQPFSQDSKAVRLNEQSTLSFRDSLPRMDGATALYPLYSAFVQATYPEKEYSTYRSEIAGGTTPKAFSRLIDGEVDLIFCAAPSDKQIKEAEEKGKTFHLTPIGREAFVFFVNKKNPVRDITLQQIRDIYSGKITNWHNLGGNYEEIRAFQRPEGSGSQTMLERIMGDAPLLTPLEEERVGGMGGIIVQTAQYKNYGNAIGYTFLFFATGMVKNEEIILLKINGIYPDRTTIEDNSYPFAGDFYAITTDTQNDNVAKFIDWVLSPQGQYLVQKTGYTPINFSYQLSVNSYQ